MSLTDLYTIMLVRAVRQSSNESVNANIRKIYATLHLESCRGEFDPLTFPSNSPLFYILAQISPRLMSRPGIVRQLIAENNFEHLHMLFLVVQTRMRHLILDELMDMASDNLLLMVLPYCEIGFELPESISQGRGRELIVKMIEHVTGSDIMTQREKKWLFRLSYEIQNDEEIKKVLEQNYELIK